MRCEELKRRRLWAFVTGLGFLWIILNVSNVQVEELKTRNNLNAENKAGKERPEFKDFETVLFTRTYHTVCITHRNVKRGANEGCDRVWLTRNKTYQMECRFCNHEQKQITVYQDSVPLFGVKTYQLVGFSPLGYVISFKSQRQLPAHFTIVENQTAYFLGRTVLPNEPYNFFHFTKQIYFPLYWLITSTNQLRKGAHNVVFYPGPYAMCNKDTIHYHDAHKFKHFREILHIKDNFEMSAYVDTPQPNNVCYRNAVFSTETFLDKAKDAISHFKGSLNIADDLCGSKILTIINRSSYRRILNTDELKQVGEDLGYDTRVVYMERLSLEEQTQLIHCTSILVGVTGAGLQWAFFMQDHSGLIEIAWPDKEWHFFFSGTGFYHSQQRDVIRPLNIVQLRAQCHFNPAAMNIYIKELFKKETNFSYQESLDIFNNWRNYKYRSKPVMSVGKLCDVTVDPKEFRKTVIAAGIRES